MSSALRPSSASSPPHSAPQCAEAAPKPMPEVLPRPSQTKNQRATGARRRKTPEAKSEKDKGLWKYCQTPEAHTCVQFFDEQQVAVEDAFPKTPKASRAASCMREVQAETQAELKQHPAGCCTKPDTTSSTLRPSPASSPPHSAPDRAKTAPKTMPEVLPGASPHDPPNQAQNQRARGARRKMSPLKDLQEQMSVCSTQPDTTTSALQPSPASSPPHSAPPCAESAPKPMLEVLPRASPPDPPNLAQNQRGKGARRRKTPEARSEKPDSIWKYCKNPEEHPLVRFFEEQVVIVEDALPKVCFGPVGVVRNMPARRGHIE
ncbi:hypothetical protein BDK51DRAFT_48883, partial [Blyttiomyces helicus]